MRHSTVLLALALMSSSAFALTDSEVSQLVLVDQTELGRLMTDRVAFMPGGFAVVGGWLEWPQSPVVLCLPNTLPVMQIGLQAASPRFAVSPDGQRLALWKRVTVDGQELAELNIVHFDTQMVSAAGDPVPITPSLHLAWLPSGELLYAADDPQQPVGRLHLVDLAGGPPRVLKEFHHGQWVDLRPGPLPGQVLALWGAPPATYAVFCGAEAPPAQAVAAGVPAPDDSRRTLEIDPEGALIIGVSTTEGVIVDRGVRGACWRPDGRALLYVKDKQVLISSGRGQDPRVLADVSQDPNLFLRGCSWSDDGVHIGFWGASGSAGRAWRASLGLERILARFVFAKEAPVAADSRLWIVSKFQRDVMGNIIEPVWNTLKGQFTVTRILRTPEGVIAESVSAGAQSGVVERLAAGPAQDEEKPGQITIGVAGQTPSTWSRTSSLEFRPGLMAWLEKTKYVGQPESLQVERQMLPPIAR